MKRDQGIIAYGTPDDRAKLAHVAHASGVSGSEWMIKAIRARYVELFGDLPPPEKVKF